jgi:hypothetical protein
LCPLNGSEGRGNKEAFLGAGQIFVLILWLIATLQAERNLDNGSDRQVVRRNFLAFF